VEISEITENGAYYPLFMLILQQLYKTQGRTKLTQLFNNSKVRCLLYTVHVFNELNHLFIPSEFEPAVVLSVIAFFHLAFCHLSFYII